MISSTPETKVRHPQTNGSVEKLNQIIQNEFYATAFRKRLYKTLEEMQEDLDIFMNDYNKERTNQGKRCQGRTPRFLERWDLRFYFNILKLTFLTLGEKTITGRRKLSINNEFQADNKL